MSSRRDFERARRYDLVKREKADAGPTLGGKARSKKMTPRPKPGRGTSTPWDIVSGTGRKGAEEHRRTDNGL